MVIYMHIYTHIYCHSYYYVCLFVMNTLMMMLTCGGARPGFGRVGLGISRGETISKRQQVGSASLMGSHTDPEA